MKSVRYIVYFSGMNEEFEEKARRELQDIYDGYYNKWKVAYANWEKETNAYYKWKAWRDARNAWTQEMSEKGYMG